MMSYQFEDIHNSVFSNRNMHQFNYSIDNINQGMCHNRYDFTNDELNIDKM